jgi:hypothetical protein
VLQTTNIEAAMSEAKRIARREGVEVIGWRVHAPSMGYPGGIGFVVAGPGEDVAARPTAHRDRERVEDFRMRPDGVLVINYDEVLERVRRHRK